MYLDILNLQSRASKRKHGKDGGGFDVTADVSVIAKARPKRKLARKSVVKDVTDAKGEDEHSGATEAEATDEECNDEDVGGENTEHEGGGAGDAADESAKADDAEGDADKEEKSSSSSSSSNSSSSNSSSGDSDEDAADVPGVDFSEVVAIVELLA